MKRAAAAIAAAAAVVVLGGRGAANGATWNGGTGNWNLSSNWAGGVPNSAGATALIDGGKSGASAVTLDISPSITSLTLDTGDTLTIGGSRTLTLSGGATVNGVVTIAGGDDKTGLVFNGAQTIGGTGQIRFGGPSFLTNFIGGTGPLTIGAGMTIRTDTQSGQLTATSLTNQGTIQNQTMGTIVEVKGDRFVNSGTIRCTGGLMFITASSWTNTGTIELSGNGLVAFGGTVTTAGLNLPGLVRTNGVLFITGLLDNSNATLPLTVATGSFDLSNGGTLRGGIVTTTGGPQLFVGQSAVGTLDGVTLRCPFNLQSGATLHLVNGLRVENGVVIGMDSSAQATSIVVDSAQTLSGNGQLRFAGNETAANFVNGTGALTIGPGIAVFPQSSSKGGTFNVATLVNQGSIFGENAEGTVTINSPTFVNNGTLRAEFDGTLVLNSGVSGTGSASVGPTGGKIRATFLRQGSLTLEGTAGDPSSFGRVTINTKASGGQTSVVKTLSIQIDGAGKPLGVLDLADTALVVDYAGGSPIVLVRRAIASGYAGEAWTGPGITSSVAAGGTSRGLGYGEASEVLGAGGGTFEGQPVDGTAVVVRFTLYGDATLDGVVDFNDLVKLAQNYNTNVSAAQSQWVRGDFTYDGVVDFNDLVKLAQNYNTALPGGPVPGAGADFLADLVTAAAQAPEPGFTGLAGVSAAAVGLRRRRQR